MSQINYHRISDWNHSIHGLDKQTSFEAGFSRSEDGLFLHGRVLDAEGVEIARSGDLRDLAAQKYKNWQPSSDLDDFIEAIAKETVCTEPAYFQAPMLEVSLEVKAPVATPQVFATTMAMATKFILLGSYEWRDSGGISFFMLCHQEALLEFARGLKTDLIALTAK